ncbi:hypothetical protein RchiOBHm_Chr5g0024311 [Rosa chinensis]|uniref:Uncharacterized protein n=1 Tax=Rosa chinensis TaxID=74649 RepID=A0A2P6Q8B7_ROSCH|nr:hypothetical protein RchiOBHm_Chr5g0024311 [Rosa chinensis]
MTHRDSLARFAFMFKQRIRCLRPVRWKSCVRVSMCRYFPFFLHQLVMEIWGELWSFHWFAGLSLVHEWQQNSAHFCFLPPLGYARAVVASKLEDGGIRQGCSFVFLTSA